MPSRLCCFLVTVFWFFLAGGQQPSGQQPDFRLILTIKNPIAVASLPSLPEAGYYFLTADGAVYRYVRAGSGLEFSNRFSLEGPGDGIDLTVVGDEQGRSVVVTEWIDKLHLGFVQRYSPEGKVLSYWSTRHIPSGVDYDPINRLVYFATADSNELYVLDPHGGEPHAVCEIRGAMQVGAIAVDPDQQLVFAGDTQGRVFQVDLKSKKVTPLKVSFGLASALWIDGKYRTLYVVDAVKKRIYALALSSQKKPVVVESGKLANPTGLAPGPGNTLLVTDQKSGGAYLAQIAPSGSAKPVSAKSAAKK
jgi:DNA-binding beta-propeller fold protein YncE